MALIAVLSLQFIIMIASILSNGFGIYTFHKRTKGNKNQHLLLKNLAAVEILKIISDFVSVLLYYLSNNLYNSGLMFLMVVEINLMTMLYLSFVGVNVDRLLCVVLEGNYTKHVTQKATKILATVHHTEVEN